MKNIHRICNKHKLKCTLSISFDIVTGDILKTFNPTWLEIQIIGNEGQSYLLMLKVLMVCLLQLVWEEFVGLSRVQCCGVLCCDAKAFYQQEDIPLGLCSPSEQTARGLK